MKKVEIIQIQNLFAVIRTIAIFPIEKKKKKKSILRNILIKLFDGIDHKLKKIIINHFVKKSVKFFN